MSNNNIESKQPISSEMPKTERIKKLETIRWLYAGASTTLLILMFLGFQQFYLHGKAAGGRPLTLPIRTLVIMHGITMTLWVIVLVVQSFLVTLRNVP